MTISQVTPYAGIAPARVGQTQTEFSNNGDDMNAYFAVIADSMNLSIDGINLAVIDINANTIIASDSADTASAAANFKGEWSNLTGALNVPASVFHNDSYWQLINNLADVTLSEPTSLSADWKISYSELNGIARGLNKVNEAVKYGRAGEVLGVEVLYIYNPVEEVTWELPTLTQPDEVIVSVALSVLVTDIDTYALIAVTPLTKISDSVILTNTDVAGSSLAVKTAADKADAAQSTADDAVNLNGLAGNYEVILAAGFYTAGTFSYPNSHTELDYDLFYAVGASSTGSNENPLMLTKELILTPWVNVTSILATGLTVSITRVSSTSFSINSGGRGITQIIGFLKEGVV